MGKLLFFNKYQPKDVTVGTDFTGHPEVCNQQAAEECEINKLLHQFEAGDIDQLPVVRECQYNDILINPTSFEQAKDLINKVENDFYSLPVDMQRQFGSVSNYVKDIGLISQGDALTIAKYNNFRLTSPSSDGSDIASAGIPSSSISASDSEIGSTNLIVNNNNDFAGKE